jgi:deoxyhypusine synthase
MPFADSGVQVYVEATVAFPLIVAATFANPENSSK